MVVDEWIPIAGAAIGPLQSTGHSAPAVSNAEASSGAPIAAITANE
jgi:hypothetical protein